jgi:hypothetical protein
VHLGLRLSGLFLLLAVALWPRSRHEQHDRATLGVAQATHLAVTTTARRATNDPPRPRAAKVASESVGDGEQPVPIADDTTVTN